MKKTLVDKRTFVSVVTVEARPVQCCSGPSARYTLLVVHVRKRRCNTSRFGHVALVCIDLQRPTCLGNHLSRLQSFLPFSVLCLPALNYSCGHFVDGTNGAFETVTDAAPGGEPLGMEAADTRHERMFRRLRPVAVKVCGP